MRASCVTRKWGQVRCLKVLDWPIDGTVGSLRVMCSNVYIRLSMIKVILKDLKKNLGDIASSNMYAKHACAPHPLAGMLSTHCPVPQ